MPRASIVPQVALILEAQVARLSAAALERELTDAELDRLDRLVRVDKFLVEPLTAEERASAFPHGDELVAALKPKREQKRDPVLFPKHGPKATTGIHEEP